MQVGEIGKPTWEACSSCKHDPTGDGCEDDISEEEFNAVLKYDTTYECFICGRYKKEE